MKAPTGSLELYGQFQQHRITRGPGPATTPHPVSRTIMMRGAVPMADHLNRQRRNVQSVKHVDGSMSIHVGDVIRKAGSAPRNGVKRDLEFERAAAQRRLAEDRAARQHQQLGDSLKRALRQLETIGTSNNRSQS